MKKLFVLIASLFLIVPLLFFGCGSDGDTGPAGPPGAPGVSGAPTAPGFPAPPASPTETAIETCDVCHGASAQLLPMSQYHDAPVTNPVNTLVATITTVTFPVAPNPIRPTVNFTLTLNGAAFATLTSNRASFAIAKLVPDNVTTGDPNRWQSYINRAATPDGNPVPVIPGTVDQATTESGSTGTFVNNGGGSYSYTFLVNLDNAVALEGDAAMTRMPNDFAFGTTSCGMRPNPINPITLPRSRRIGTTFGIFQVPLCTWALIIGIFRTRARSSAIAWSETSSMQ